MSTPICDPQLLVRPSTSGEALAALDEAQHQMVAAEVAQLVAICHIADLWKIDQSVVAEGMERLIQAGHDGTPRVGEFVAGEVGALLGLSPSLALSRIGEALDLRARHPKLWDAVIAGKARVWQARKVSSECAHLPLETVLKVDDAMAAGIGQLPFQRVLKALPGQIVAADTDLARERAQARRASRQIRVSKIQDGSVSIFGVVDPADGINFDRLLTDIATGLPVEPDRVLCTDLDRRRNLAFSMIVRDAWARAHGEQPVFELHGDDLIALPPGRVVGLTADTPVPDTVGPSWIRTDGSLLAGARLGLAEQVKKAKAVRERRSAALREQWGKCVPGDAALLHPDPSRPLSDMPLVEPGGCVKVLAGHVPEPAGWPVPDRPRSPYPAGEGARGEGGSRASSADSAASVMAEPDGAVPRVGGLTAHGPLLGDTPAAGDREGVAGPALPLAQRVSDSAEPHADGLTTHGPVLYDTRAAAELEGIAGPPLPVTQTLVVHISADDPALAAARRSTTIGGSGGVAESSQASGVARVEGWGPLLTEQLPEFLAGSKVIVRPVIDPAGMRPVDCYETPARMRFAVEQRNPVDVFPYGTAPASRCDMDHTIPFTAGQAGQTRPGNLGPLSRKTHRMKTHGGWQLEQPEPGVYHWTSPHGFQYQVTAAGTTRIAVPETS